MKTVILVEDNPDNMDLVTDMLEDRFELIPFSSALDLLAYLKDGEAKKPEAFILDISLPANGWHHPDAQAPGHGIPFALPP
jgi:CheY-like chemotaxis protein